MRHSITRKSVDAVVFDLDGVIWHNYVAIEGARSTISQLRNTGLKIAYLTNTSSRSESFLAAKLRKVGISASPKLIFTSGRITAEYIARKHRSNEVVVVHGARGVLLDHIRSAGVTAVALRDLGLHDELIRSASAVVVVLGYTTSFTHADVVALLELSPRVTNFYAPERDRWYGTAAGPRPGAGWIVSAGEEILGRPARVLGKPSEACLQTVASVLNVPVETILMVGDSRDSDIAAARAANSLSCLVDGSGNRLSDTSGAEPDIVIDSLEQLIHLLQEGSDT